jgi:hypothetical protein
MGEPGTERITFFGQTNFRNKKVKFGIKTDDRRRHLYTIGKTGMGKSQLLENMMISDIRNGYGACMIDPHGDMVENIIQCVPRNRVDDIIYFNPADVEHPIAFNVFEKVDVKYRPLVASGVVGVFKKIWADSWGPRLEYILNNCILALLEAPDSTLLGVMRILTDRKYREQVVREVTDPMIKYFWTREFSKYPEKEIAMIISPIQNKVGQYLSNAMIRNVVGQPVSTINLRQIMDQRKVLLLNLSKGRIGEDASALLGALMITKIQLAAMSRVDIVEKNREDFYLYVDELQNFATDSFAGILSEARKYHLNLTMAHQYIEQLPETLQAAVFGNVGTMISFRVGANDAEYLAKEFAPTFIEEDFVNLPKFHIYLKLMIDGVASQGFSANTLPPIAKPEGFEQMVVENSRQKYSRPVELVEQEFLKWWNLNDANVPVETEAKSDKEVASTEKSGDENVLADLSETVKNQVSKMIHQNQAERQEHQKVLTAIEKKITEPKTETVKTETAKVEISKVETAKAEIPVPAELEVKKVPGFEKLEQAVPDTTDWYNIEKKTKELSFDGKYNCDVCSADMFLDFAPRLDKPILCQKCVKKRDKFMKRVKREKEESRALDMAEREADRRLSANDRPATKSYAAPRPESLNRSRSDSQNRSYSDRPARSDRPTGGSRSGERFQNQAVNPKASNWGMMKTAVRPARAEEQRPASKVTFENENFDDDLKNLYGDADSRQQPRREKAPPRNLPPATIRIVGKPIAPATSTKTAHEHKHTHFHVHTDLPVKDAPVVLEQISGAAAPAKLATTDTPAVKVITPKPLATPAPKPVFNPFGDQSSAKATDGKPAGSATTSAPVPKQPGKSGLKDLAPGEEVSFKKDDK